MNAITPPKLMPPCQSAAASGTLPIEQTKLMMAMNGPTMTFSQRGPEAVAVEEHAVPRVGGDQHGQEAGDDVADDQLASQHREVGDRVARGVGPRPRERSLTDHGRAFQFVLTFVADPDHGVVVVAADHRPIRGGVGPVRRACV